MPFIALTTGCGAGACLTCSFAPMLQESAWCTPASDWRTTSAPPHHCFQLHSKCVCQLCAMCIECLPCHPDQMCKDGHNSPRAGMGSDRDDTAASIIARLCLLCRSAVRRQSLLSGLPSCCCCCWPGLLGAAWFAALNAVLKRYWRLFELGRALLTLPVNLRRSDITCPGGCMPTSDSSIDIPMISEAYTVRKAIYLSCSNFASCCFMILRGEMANPPHMDSRHREADAKKKSEL